MLYTTVDPPRLFAVPLRGGIPRLVAELPGIVVAVTADPTGYAHLRIDRDRAEAWRVPIAGGAVERELEPPWCGLVYAPRGSWAIAQQCPSDVIYLIAPGTHPTSESPHIEHAFRFAWDWNGESIVYWNGREVRRHYMTGNDELLFDAPYVNGVAPSPDGKTIYFGDVVSHSRRRLITNFGDRPRLPK